MEKLNAMNRPDWLGLLSSQQLNAKKEMYLELMTFLANESKKARGRKKTGA